ncbi:MAG: AI-2E family transporter [Cyanobacteria bacterium]|nr:AI-2E family transporter [Cyanobacteriota bacterium]
MKFGHWLTLLGTAASLALLWSLRDVLIHVFAAIVLSMALCTAVGVVRRRLGCPRPWALALTLVGLAVLGLGLGGLLIPPFVDQFSQLLHQLPAAFSVLLHLVQQGLDQTSQLIDGQKLLEAGPAAGLGMLPNSPVAPAGGGVLAAGLGGGALKLLGFAGSLSSALIQVLFVLAVSLMIAAQPTAYREVSILLVPSFYRRRFRKALLLCGEALSSWMGGVLISSCCVGLLAGIGLSLLGVKLVVANALLAGLLNVIPNVGPTLGTLFPMSVALLVSPWKSLAVLALYVVIQNLESYVITPSVMHHQVKLLPGLTLIAQFGFTVVFGPLGLVLALPLAVCLQVLVRELLIHDLLDPWKEQRLATSSASLPGRLL